MTPRLLDLYCCAGGAAKGYADAGFDVVGVDIEPQPRYPFEFHHEDALEVLDGMIATGHNFDAIHASPPCQSYSVTCNFRPENRTKYPDLVEPTRERLDALGLPYVIENVPGSPLENYVQLCGTGFGRPLRRHRWFESNVPLMGVPCAHGAHAWNPAFKHSTNRKRRRVVVIGEYRVPFDLQCEVMEVDWMTLPELSEAIPPVYTEHVGGYLMAEVERRAKLTPTSERAA